MFKKNQKADEKVSKRFNYYRSATSETTEKPKSKKPESSLPGRLFDFLIIGLLIISGAYVMIINQQPAVHINSHQYHTSAEYLAAVNRQFEPTMNRTKLTIDQAKIVSALKQQFPEINDIKIKLPLIGHQAIVDLDVSSPAFILNSSGRSFIINTSGVVAADLSNVSGTEKLSVISDESGYFFKVGQQALSQRSIDFIKAVVAESTKAGVHISKMSIPPVAQELNLKTSDSKYYTRFFLGGDPAIQIGQFLAARNDFKRTKHYPSQYLDVRVEGKIFYK